MNINLPIYTGELAVEHEFSLKPYNSFGVDAKASKLLHIKSANDVHKALLMNCDSYKVLGGGSNILFTTDIEACVLKNEISGRVIVDEDSEMALVEVGAGEDWHEFVMWTVENGLGGLENLAFIPGTVGAAPIQNIGAYGVEQMNFFHSLKAIDLISKMNYSFYKKDCNFGYRDSIFKNEAKDRYIITHVRYLLYKKHIPNVAYADLKSLIEQRGISEPTIRDVADCVIDIRKAKLPDPKIIGNAGSFFKNPAVDLDHILELKKQYPEIPVYPVDEEKAKVAAAWLIDNAGYKGVRRGNTGTHDRQALVIINTGNATGLEILNFSDEIRSAVYGKFGIVLEREVNIW